jgi:hypothetical protein
MLEKIKKFLIETFGSYKIFKIEKIVPAGTEQASNLKILYTELSDHFFHVSPVLSIEKCMMILKIQKK